jgi:hypothetical protein
LLDADDVAGKPCQYLPVNRYQFYYANAQTTVVFAKTTGDICRGEQGEQALAHIALDLREKKSAEI